MLAVPTPIKRVLIANRGEIAVRVARACRVLGIESVAIFSDADATARHVRNADIAVRVGPAEAAASYLSIANVLAAAHKAGADAVHPGYGFLSENTAFARAVQDAGLVWIGPPADAIEPLASKTEAKAIAQAAGVPTAPAVVLRTDDTEALTAAAGTVEFPLLVKPEHGGGGKGMQRVDRLADLAPAVAAARRIAAAAFASDSLFLERFVEHARHVEVQVLGDQHGNVCHVFERECSLQRRHQKVVEESPCALLTDAERAAICESGRAFAARIGYVGAGTVEFLFDPVRREHYFLEMNTRLQVEHPVTEEVAGVDLVVAQLRIAMGETLQAIGLGALHQRGHAVEVRVYAENPAAGYLPQTGTLACVRWPDGPFVRVDTGYETGDEVSTHYDPMLAKIIAWGPDRPAALQRLRAALRDTIIHGVITNLPMLQAVLETDEVQRGELHTGTLDAMYGASAPGMTDDPDTAGWHALAAAAHGGPMGRPAASAGPSTSIASGHSDPWATLAGFRIGGRS